MISYKDFDVFCGSLAATSKVVQWGGAHVWKVGEKVFAIGGWSDNDHPFVTFKCSPESYDILKDQSGLRPAPYFATRGMKWIQMFAEEELSADDLKLYLTQSHKLAAKTLTKKRQKELGLELL